MQALIFGLGSILLSSIIVQSKYVKLVTGGENVPKLQYKFLVLLLKEFFEKQYF